MDELNYQRIWRKVVQQDGNPPKTFAADINKTITDIESSGASGRRNVSMHMNRFRVYFTDYHTYKDCAELLGISSDAIWRSVALAYRWLRIRMPEYRTNR